MTGDCVWSERASIRAISSGTANGRTMTSSAPISRRVIRSSRSGVLATASTGTVTPAERSIVTRLPTVTGGAMLSAISTL